jgi:glucose dehydrogenase
MKTWVHCHLLFVLLIASTVTAQQPCSGPFTKALIDWTQFHFSSCRNGFNPYEFVLSPATVGNLGLKWQFDQDGLSFYSSPAVVNGVVYIGAQPNNLYALEAGTGQVLWEYPTAPLTIVSSPAVANGVVYFASLGT